MGNKESLSIMVCYAKAQQQETISLIVPSQTSVLQAIQQSGILERYPEINLSENSVGIFGNVATLNQVLQDKDRVEIYRSLQMNPMEARRLRAEHDDI